MIGLAERIGRSYFFCIIRPCWSVVGCYPCKMCHICRNFGQEESTTNADGTYSDTNTDSEKCTGTNHGARKCNAMFDCNRRKEKEPYFVNFPLEMG